MSELADPLTTLWSRTVTNMKILARVAQCQSWIEAVRHETGSNWLGLFLNCTFVPVMWHWAQRIWLKKVENGVLVFLHLWGPKTGIPLSLWGPTGYMGTRLWAIHSFNGILGESKLGSMVRVRIRSWLGLEWRLELCIQLWWLDGEAWEGINC